jgi:hypothetical protein
VVSTIDAFGMGVVLIDCGVFTSPEPTLNDVVSVNCPCFANDTLVMVSHKNTFSKLIVAVQLEGHSSPAIILAFNCSRLIPVLA